MNSKLLKVRLHVGGSPDIDIYVPNITIDDIRMNIYKWLIFQIQDLSSSDLRPVLNFVNGLVIYEGVDLNENFKGYGVTLRWIFKEDENSLPLSDMKNNKGLSKEELIKKYGDDKSDGFNEGIKRTIKPGPKKVQPSTSPKTPVKKK